MHSSSNLLSNYFPGTLLPGVPKRGVVSLMRQYVFTASPRLQSAMAKLAFHQERKSTEDAEVMHTKKEVADYLRVSLATVDRLVRAGQIQILKIGRSVRITEKALRRFLASQEVKR